MVNATSFIGPMGFLPHTESKQAFGTSSSNPQDVARDVIFHIERQLASFPRSITAKEMYEVVPTSATAPQIWRSRSEGQYHLFGASLVTDTLWLLSWATLLA